MFYNDGYVMRSSILSLPGTVHAFSTRLGGISTLPHTKSMNIAPRHGDSEDTVRRNTELLAEYLGGGFTAADTVCAHQIHSAKVRYVGVENRGEGTLTAPGEDCDGFVTDVRGIVPIVRTADCTPIIMCAPRDAATPVIAVLHAGWRGTVADIAGQGVRKMTSLGVKAEDIRAAVGPHIGFCCFEVGEDLRDSVRSIRGEDFASRHIRYVKEKGKLYADLTGMNIELLCEAGVLPSHTDVSEECTFCLENKYHSHRRGAGLRGAMGSLAAIL